MGFQLNLKITIAFYAPDENEAFYFDFQIGISYFELIKDE